MSENLKSEDNTSERNESSNSAADKTNPCGICRASGVPVCKGHGGGGSGGGSGGSDGNDSKPEKDGAQAQPGSATLSSPSPKPTSGDIVGLLEKSQLWSQSGEFIFDYKNPSSLLSMTLNLERNTLTFEGRSDLTKEEKQDRDLLLKAIQQEFSLFRKEIPTTIPMHLDMSRDSNQMTIKIPDQKCFDAFIQRLVDKNLLMTQPSLEPKPTRGMDDAQTPEEHTSRYAAPTPFSLDLKLDKK